MNRLKKSYSTCLECGGKTRMKSGGNWIQSAIKKPGSFTAQAKGAGMSVPAFRDRVLANKEDFSSTTVKRANLAKTLSKMRKGEMGMMTTSAPVSTKTTKNFAIKSNKGQAKVAPKMSTIRSKDRYGEDGMEMEMGSTDPTQINLMDSNTMRRKEMLGEREAQLQEKKNGIPENQMAPLSMMRGGRLYAQLGMLNGKAIQGPKPAPVADKPAVKAMSNAEGMDEVPRIEAIDPKLTQAKAMLKEDNKALEMAKVKDYQMMLNKKYGAGLATDGAWGPKTQAAYEKYMLKPAATTTKSSGDMRPSRADMQGNFKMNFNTPVSKGTMGPSRADMPGNFRMNFNTPAAPTATASSSYKGTSQPLWQTAKETQSFIPGKAGDMVVNPNYSFLNKPANKTNATKAVTKSTTGGKAPIQIPGSSEKKKTAVVDNRQLPLTGVLVDRGTNETFVFGKDNNFQFPVLTGQNRNMYADANTFTVDQLEKDKSGRVTPTGYYIFDQNNVSASDKKSYNNNIRHLEPITAFGTAEPQATNIAVHQTYDPARRAPYYDKSGDQRGKSYGCINGRCGDVATMFNQVADRDTVMVIDSRRPEDQQFLKQAQKRVAKKQK
jgi:hypothetical protein